ncbi:YgfZ/GcvT domain-containing protein [Limimaricola hongkongensis]|uniref:Folate-dependent protein for Fe/S cluster synthesis/repair in oxidative stress n=1 Tax=Limimaricola hongkongensis DSM 17492 TaxID=1122180 RepID=A0A017HBN4_9RHOB|nr:folate-binding protein YgfZ [Limimaricola hongkongensis]EYD71194.1 Folate-dependent protein for Fe/S cluster synthesis/repair in oxidative stress [Limimaricola hongkongensis DSM 17492]
MTQDRTIIAVTGADREEFLQGLVTNDIARAKDKLAYAALLTPQGKLIADFFLKGEDARFLIDVDAGVAPQLFQRLSMYKLRADVALAEADVKVSRGTGPAPEGALPDPRHPDLGWRLYGAASGDDGTDWTAIRVAKLIPEWGSELGPESYILEAGFERMGGVDFKKGCYVGQEVTARMKHKTELRKGFARVAIDGAADPGTSIMSGDKAVGTLHSRAGDEAIAWLRFDRAQGEMHAGEARVTRAD